MSGKRERTSETVKVGSVSLLLYPWTNSAGREYWRFMWHDPDTGKRKYGTRATKEKAKRFAREKAVQLANGNVDLNALDDPVRRNVLRLLAADPRLDQVDEYLTWKAAAYPQKATAAAVAEFIALKDANKGRSIQNVRSLRKHLTPLARHFGDRPLASITVPELEAFLTVNPANGNRTRRNIRGALVTFFKWAANAGHLPEGKTAAEKTGVPIVRRKIPATWEPDEMAVMLDAVRPEYLAWLAAAAFGGFRSDEISPLAGGEKSPLDWSDFKWDRKVVIVRPETDKNGHRRVVPILPALRHWLWPIRQQSGPLCAVAPPHKVGRGAKTKVAETARLGALVGGWKKNALRHTWISCRAAEVGIAQTAMEAGNSEKEAKKSYNDAKGKDEAKQWFNLTKKSVAERLRNLSETIRN